MRCLTCLGVNHHTAWCGMVAERPAEMPAEASTGHVGAPVWSVACIVLGVVLLGLSLVGVVLVNAFVGGRIVLDVMTGN